MFSDNIQTQRVLIEMRHDRNPMEKPEVEFVVNSVDNVCIFGDGDDGVNAEAKRPTLV
jgi:hypothetical protein